MRQEGEKKDHSVKYLLVCILEDGCYFSGRLLSPELGSDLLYLASLGSNVLLLDCNLDTGLGVTDQKQTSDGNFIQNRAVNRSSDQSLNLNCKYPEFINDLCV